MWSGIEYLFAAQLIYAGMVREGVQGFESMRRRFDGERRNPWDEPECGHPCARAMSAWSGLLAPSGFRYHGAEKAVVAKPRVSAASFPSFWSAATGWGAFSQVTREGRTRFSLSLLSGRLPCRSVELGCEAPTAAVPTAKLGAKSPPHQLRRGDKQWTFVLSNAAELAEGGRLILENIGCAR